MQWAYSDPDTMESYIGIYISICIYIYAYIYIYIYVTSGDGVGWSLGFLGFSSSTLASGLSGALASRVPEEFVL